MTNTAKIGAQYELAYKRRMEADRFIVTARQAGSKGPFDLMMWLPDGNVCFHVQLSCKRFSCNVAEERRDALERACALPRGCTVLYVHRTRSEEFCGH